jgi:hypothetical protein
MENNESAQALPATIDGTGGDGHRYRYRVIGTWSDGSIKTSSWDAQHLDDCSCSNPDEWY